MDRLTKILHSQYIRYHRNPEDNIIIVTDPENIRIWYALIIGNEYPYKYAEIIFKFTIPDKYPHDPPSVECLTPNGIFLLGKPFCVSIGEFHKDDWVKSLGITGYSKQLWNALLFFTQKDIKLSINVIWSSPDIRQDYSNKSYNYNKKNNKYIHKLVDQYIEDYPEYLAVKLLKKNRLCLKLEKSLGKVFKTR
jgi:ubiquitin-protein ligase